MLLAQLPADPMNTPLVVALSGVVASALTLAAQFVARQIKSKSGEQQVAVNVGAREGSASDGRFQERMEWMLKGITETVTQLTDAQHAEMRPLVASMNDAAQSMRLAVNELAVQTPLVREMHAATMQAHPTKTTRRRRR